MRRSGGAACLPGSIFEAIVRATAGKQRNAALTLIG